MHYYYFVRQCYPHFGKISKLYLNRGSAHGMYNILCSRSPKMKFELVQLRIHDYEIEAKIIITNKTDKDK